MRKQTRTKRTAIAVFCAAMLFAIPAVVQAQFYDVTVTGTISSTTLVSGVDVGIALDGDTELHGTGTSITFGAVPDSYGVNLYDLLGATININKTFTGVGGAAGILTADATACFLPGNITISGTATGTNKDIRGFWYNGSTPFRHYIGYHHVPDVWAAPANITVRNNGGDGNAYGVLFGNAGTPQDIVGGALSFLGAVHFGNITVSSKNDAWGFLAGDIDKGGNGNIYINLGNITVTATGTTDPNDPAGCAVGMQLGTAGANTPWGPSLWLETGNITVNTDRLNAFGVHAESLNARSIYDPPDNFGNFGIINVTSTNTSPSAVTAGISVQKDSEFILDNDITVSANGGTAWGIYAYEDITHQTQDVTIQVLDNYTITVSGAGNNIGVQANNLTLYGDPLASKYVTADLGKVIAEGNVIIGKADKVHLLNVIVAEGSKFNGTANELHDSTSLKLNFASPEGKVAGFGAWTVYGNERLIQSDSGTEYYFDQESASGPWYIFAKRAPIKSDAFLAASTIHNRYTAYTMVRDKFISGDSQCCHYLGQAPYGYGVPGDLYDPHAWERKERAGTSWLNYVGRADTYGNWNLGANGLQLGTDLYLTNKTQFGVIFGYEDGWAKNNSDLVKSDDIYTGLYAARILRNKADLRFIYNLGWQHFDMARDDSAYLSSFRGRTQEINVELGKRYHWDVWSARPSIATDFYLNHLGTATETNGVQYDRFNMMQCFLRTGLDFRYQGPMFTVNSGFAFAYDVNNPNFSTIANGLPLRGSKLGREVWMYNIGAECQVYRNVSVFGGYDGQAVADRANSYQHIGYIGVAARW